MGTDTDTASVYATLSAGVLSCLSTLIIFEIVRHQREIYFPRLRSNKYRSPSPAPNTLLGWVFHTLSISDEDTLSMIGMDAFVVLRYIRLCFKVIGICGVLSAFVLIPIYSSAPAQSDIQGINTYTMANLEQGGNKLWMSVLCCWIFSGLFMHFLTYEYEYFIYLRQRFLKEGDPDVPSQKLFTVKVENIPEECQSNQKFRCVFEDLFPGEVSVAVCSQELHTLEGAIALRDDFLNRLETALGYASGHPKKNGKPLMLNVAYGSPVWLYGGEPFPVAIQYLVWRLKMLNDEISKLKTVANQVDDEGFSSRNSYKDLIPMVDIMKSPLNLIPGIGGKNKERESNASIGVSSVDEVSEMSPLTHEDVVMSRIVMPNIVLPIKDQAEAFKLPDFSKPKYSSTGFVTFSTRRSTALAYQVSMLTNRYPDIKVDQVKESDDIIWNNISTPVVWNEYAMMITDGLYTAGIVFWTAMLAFIAALSNLDNISKYLPFLNGMDQVSYAFVSGLLPVFVLMFFMNNIPVFMAYFSIYFEKLKSYSDVSERVFKWFTRYQLANIYLLLVTGSVFDKLSDAIDNPASIFYLLGEALPSMSVFFINYLITTIFIGISSQLLVIFPHLMLYFYGSFGGESMTRRQLYAGPLADVNFDYGQGLSYFLYVLCVVHTYWILSPIITVIGAAFFACCYLLYKYQFLFMNVRQFETGGTFFYGLVDTSCASLMMSAGLMCAYISLKEGVKQAPFLLPLPFVIYWYWGKLHDRYKLKSLHMAYNCAIDGDLSTVGEKSSTTLAAAFNLALYRQPCLSSASSEVMPTPHRVNSIPILTKKGELHTAYYTEAEVSPDEFYQDIVAKYFDDGETTEYASSAYQAPGEGSDV